MNLEKKVVRKHLDIQFTWPVGADWRKYRTKLKKLVSTCDAVIVNGEGTIHSTDERERAQFTAAISELASENDKPSYLINATVQNLGSAAIQSLRKYRKIFVREGKSKDFLLSFGIESEVVPDLSFITNYENLDFHREGILFTDSVSEETSVLLQNKANEILAKYSPMRCSHKDKKTLARLSNFGKRVRNRLYSPARFTWEPDHDLINRWLIQLCQSKLVVTGRFHTVTMCILTKTPFVFVSSNTHKIESVVRDVFANSGRQLLSYEIDQLSAEELEKYSSFSEYELNCIDNYLKRSWILVEKMFDEIKADILSIK